MYKSNFNVELLLFCCRGGKQTILDIHSLLSIGSDVQSRNGWKIEIRENRRWHGVRAGDDGKSEKARQLVWLNYSSNKIVNWKFWQSGKIQLVFSTPLQLSLPSLIHPSIHSSHPLYNSTHFAFTFSFACSS